MWSEVKWSEVKWSEVKWSEVKWSEVKKWSEAGTKRKVKKNILMDLVQLIWNPPPPPRKHEKWTQPETPPPLWTKSIKMFSHHSHPSLMWHWIDGGASLAIKWKQSPAFVCWEFPPQMALIISCDVINNDLVVKFYIFILYLNLCNIFRWDNFLYRKDFYIERIYYQFKLYIYCLVFLVFLMIFWLPLLVSAHRRNFV